MTIEEFINGYNLVSAEKLAVEYLTKGATSSDGAYTAKSDGYAIKNETGIYSNRVYKEITQEYNGMNFYINSTSNAKWTWFSSISYYGSEYGMGFGYDNRYNIGSFPTTVGVSSSHGGL